MFHTLDDLDRKIVAMLQRDGRTSNVVMARELGLSEGTVRKRVERLLGSGIIRVTAVADPTKLELNTPVYIAIEADLAHLTDVAEYLAAMPEVCSVKMVTGAFDVIIEAVLPSSDQLLPFLIDHIAVIPGVKRTETYHVLKIVKQACEWAMPDTSDSSFAQAPGIRWASEVIPGAIVVPS
jgi:Lrp/AsnC family transcriptional regulator for asnA, asnC and gidA